MEKLSYISLLWIFVVLWMSCNNNSTNTEGTERDSDIAETTIQLEPKQNDKQKEVAENKNKVHQAAQEVETENHHLLEKEDLRELEYLMEFIPENHLVLDYEYGDLNHDELKNDVILIAYNPEEKIKEDNEFPRPLFILIRNSEGKLIPAGRNDAVTLCSHCGGVMGDPYQDIAIKNGYFSIEHYGGSSWRWTEIITFKYDGEAKNWFLHKKGGVSFHASEPEKSKETVKTKKDFGTISFADYK